MMQLFSSNRKTEPATPPATPAPLPPPISSNGAKPVTSAGATLSRGVFINGSVKFRNEMFIDGEVKGSIESAGRLTLGKNAQIRGGIKTKSITVHGIVQGDITAAERCELRTGCSLRGDIEAPRLVVDDDTTFVGNAKIATQD